MYKDTTDKIIFAGVVIFIILVLGIRLFFTFFNVMTPGNGQHTGYVTAVETYGVVWKTSAVYIKTDTQSSQEDKYCVQDVNVLEQLKLAAETKDKVTVIYDSSLIVPNWKCGGEQSIIIGIK